MAQLFTSDHHIGHTNILTYCAATRPYSGIEEMAADYLERWNAKVQPDDLVWYVGDLSLQLGPGAEFLAKAHGHKVLVVGNHDLCFKLQPEKVEAYLQAGFEKVLRTAQVDIQGQRFVLNHFPYRPPLSELSCDVEVARRQRKVWKMSVSPGDAQEQALVHGHVHSFWRARVGRAALPELNMSVDAWSGNPVHETELLALLEQAQARQGPGQLNWQGQWEPLYEEPAESGEGPG